MEKGDIEFECKQLEGGKISMHSFRGGAKFECKQSEGVARFQCTASEGGLLVNSPRDISLTTGVGSNMLVERGEITKFIHPFIGGSPNFQN